MFDCIKFSFHDTSLSILFKCQEHAKHFKNMSAKNLSPAEIVNLQAATGVAVLGEIRLEGRGQSWNFT